MTKWDRHRLSGEEATLKHVRATIGRQTSYLAPIRVPPNSEKIVKGSFRVHVQRKCPEGSLEGEFEEEKQEGDKKGLRH